MKITMYYSSLVYYENGKYYTHPMHGRLLEEYAKNFDGITIFAPINNTRNEDQVFEISPKLNFIHLPYFNSYLSSLKKPFKVLKTFYKEYPKDTDILQFRVPGPYGIFLMLYALYRNTSVVAHIVGDSGKIVKEGKKYKGISKKLINVYNTIEKGTIKFFSNKIKIMVNGSDLHKEYLNKKKQENILQLRSSTLLKTDFYERRDLDLEEEDSYISLLYVGYLRHEKGLEYLLYALQNLVDDYPAISLKIVGDGPEKESLIKLSETLNISQNVNFTGYVPLGEKLNQIYINSDIFILPSISEGTPRVLLEAMAKGLPVIATDVGGIPNTINHYDNGILVRQKSFEEITKAVKLLINNRDLYNKLKNNGFQFAKSNLLESVIKDMVSFAHQGVRK